MSADVLSMNNFKNDNSAVEIAIPVIAVECEVTPPIHNYMDAYEVAVLNLVNIGLSSTSVLAATIGATESLIQRVLDSLKSKGYLDKEKGKPWTVTKTGKEYLNGETEKDIYKNDSVYGYMFINAIKKEIFPFFYRGNINQVNLFRGTKPLYIKLNNDEKKTFSEFKIKKTRLRDAFKKYIKLRETKTDLENGNIEFEEAVSIADDVDFDDQFVEIDQSVDEDFFEEAVIANNKNESVVEIKKENDDHLSSKMFIRPLEGQKKNIYLHMQIIINPSLPGGFKVESPFELKSIDTSYYLRQIQWLAGNPDVTIGDKRLKEFLEFEIRKISPHYSNKEKDFEVFVLEKIPLLKSQKNIHGNLYDDMERIYTLIQNQDSMIDKENIVSNISRSVLECLYNGFFREIDVNTRNTISEQAIEDLKAAGNTEYISNLFRNTGLENTEFDWKFRFIHNAVGRLGTTKGNSTLEKFINIAVINYYIGTEETERLLNSDNIKEIYEYTDELNRIRRKVSHDTDDRFEENDYELFMSKVFQLVNWLMDAYRKD